MAPPHDRLSPPRQFPGWLTKLAAAKRAALEALSAEERTEAAEDLKGRRERIKARRAASLALAQQIFALNDAGHTVFEIAAAVDRRPKTIIVLAAKRGVSISRSTEKVRRAVVLPRAREDALRRMADDYGTVPEKALDDLLTFALDDDAAVARRVLRVRRKTPDESADQVARGGPPASQRRTNTGADRRGAQPQPVDCP